MKGSAVLTAVHGLVVESGKLLPQGSREPLRPLHDFQQPPEPLDDGTRILGGQVDGLRGGGQGVLPLESHAERDVLLHESEALEDCPEGPSHLVLGDGHAAHGNNFSTSDRISGRDRTSMVTILPSATSRFNHPTSGHRGTVSGPAYLPMSMTNTFPSVTIASATFTPTFRSPPLR